jgi:hypothetical protein
MPAPLTPIEKFLRQDTNDRRTKYEQRRAAQGLVRVNVWVPAKAKQALSDYAQTLVDQHLSSVEGD